jgi:hypothetical protein
VCLLVQNGLRTLLDYWEVGPWGGGAPTGLIAPGATHPRYATERELLQLQVVYKIVDVYPAIN